VTVVFAERDLEFALAEQLRCTERFERSIGTSGELSAYTSLVAASRRVSACDRAVREAESPAPPEPFALTLLADATAPGEARREVARRVRGEVDSPVAQTVELLVGETVTNAVVHGGRSDCETVDVEGRWGADGLLLEVINAGPAFDDVAELPPATDTGGRGLFLVDAFSRDWGRRHAAGVTSVWFEVAT
jgi:anti-sigma regulatory factor (Ser/Thr protein kinase)